MADLKGRKVAILAADGVEQVELTEPKQALEAAGAQVSVLSIKPGKIQAMKEDVHPADQIAVDQEVSSAKPEAFDALLLPGGTTNPDKLRMSAEAVRFVKHFVDQGKPIAAICHGPWTLIEAGGVKGHRMTSWPSLQTDLRNAGAEWVDESCVVDGTLVTSRKPADIPAFNKHMLEVFGGQPQSRAA